MKVVHVINSLGLGGGAEHSLIAMLPEYAAHGIESEVVCLVEREHGLFEAVQAMGLPYTVLSGPNLLAQARHLRRLLKTTRPDLVHATLVDASFVTRMACLGLRVPQLHSLVSATYDPSRLEGSGVPRWKLLSLQIFDAITSRGIRGHFHANSNAVKAHAVTRLRIPPDRITVIPRGRNRAELGSRTQERRDRTRRAMDLNPDDLVVLTAGRQDAPKAQDVLVRAFDCAADQNESMILWLAGREGNATRGLVRALEDARHSRRIRVLGHRTDLADLMCAADIFALPSEYEGMPGVALEAMALGCPILGSDAEAITEVLGQGAFGMIFPRGDHDALACALLQLANDAPRREALASAAHAEFDRSYSLATSVSETVNLYRKLCYDETVRPNDPR